MLIVYCALIYDDAIRACAVRTVTADRTGKFFLLTYSLTASHCSTEAHLAGVPFPLLLLLLGPCKTPLTTTVAKFLDTSVCGGSWCLDPSLSPFLVKFTQILESILLDNPHKAAVISVGCASFSSTLFPSTQLSVNILGYSTLWTASLFCN